MFIRESLRPERTFYNLSGSSKKRILEKASELIAETVGSLDAEEIFTGLVNRERLGSTGLGNGVAIPHCRLANCEAPVCSLIKLAEAIDFEAIDNDPVDLVFVLIVPEEATDAHLQALAGVAELFGQEDYRSALRQTGSEDELFSVATEFAT